MKIVKRLILSALTWLVLTGILVAIDNTFSLSEKTDWFAFIGILLPITGAMITLFSKKKSGRFASAETEIPKESPEEIISIPPDNPAFVDTSGGFNPIPLKIPETFTEREFAKHLIEEVKEYADKINNSTDVLDFAFYYESIKETLEKLAWLNEQRKIFMYPTPRSDFQKMYNNMENTINDFIYRAMGSIKESSKEWRTELGQMFDIMETDSCLSSLMTDYNRNLIRDLRHQIEEKEETTFFKSAPPVRDIESSSAPTKRASSFVDIEQIIKDEIAWRMEQKGQSTIEHELERIDQMDGHTFEHWCASLLEAAGFTDVEVTRGSGDQGVDVLASMEGGVRYAVQCKCYASDLGNKPVQEVYAGIAIYNCQVGSVMTNRYFTSGAKELAEATGIELWDRDWIISLLKELDESEFPIWPPAPWA